MRPGAMRILGISRVVADLDRAEDFYCGALGFQPAGRGTLEAALLAALGLIGSTGAFRAVRLAADHVTLVQFAPPGRPYPAGSRSDDLWFQHLAIVTADMDTAYAHLCRQPGWTAISWGGPQRLPPADGRVQAFKLRDPDGHPLELIWFPPGQGRAIWHRPAPASPFLGIDHSALAVSLVSRSLRFYRRLGFGVTDRSWNRGAAQTALDGILDARARVIAMRPPASDGPGLELLRYRPPGRPWTARRADDIATDWVTLAVPGLPAGSSPRLLRDPDGHLLVLEAQGAADVRAGAGSTGLPACGPAT